MLLECACDPDKKVRWPAINLIGRIRSDSERTLAALIEALGDEAVEVRLQAIAALRDRGPEARPAVPALTGLLKDPAAQVVHFADVALWHIDLPAAVEASGWKRFTSPEWGFSVMMPARVEQDEVPELTGRATVRRFMALHEATNCSLAVTDYPTEAIEALTEHERLDASRNLVLMRMGGNLVNEQPCEQHGRKGREYLIEFKDERRPYHILSRLFWREQRLYVVVVTSSPEFVNPKAARYFLDSFQLIEEPILAPSADVPKRDDPKERIN